MQQHAEMKITQKHIYHPPTKLKTIFQSLKTYRKP